MKTLRTLLALSLLLPFMAFGQTVSMGDFDPGTVIYFPFNTYNSSGASVTITGLAVTDIEIYKDGSTTQRAVDNGYTLLDTDGIDFDGTTGLHGFSVDTGDNTSAGFYSSPAQFWVNVNAVTVDSQTVNFTYYFTLGRYLRASTAGRELDVSSGGEAGLDWANIGSPTTTVALSGTTVDLVTDAVDANATAANGFDASFVADDSIDAGAVAAATINDSELNVTGSEFNAIAGFGNDALVAADIAADVATELQAGLATAANLTTLTNYVDTEIADIRRAIGPATTTIASLSSQTSFTLTAGSADDNAYNGWGLVVVDASSAVQTALGCVSDYTGSTKTVTLRSDPGIFTMATSDNVILLPSFCTTGVDVSTIETVDATDQLDAHAAAGLDAAGVRSAVGLASANLDTQLTNIESGVDIDTIEGTDATNVLDALDNPTLAILGTPIDLGIGGATIGDNLQEIESQTDDIGVAGAGLTAADDTVVGLVDDIGVAGAGLSAIPDQTINLTGTWTGNISGNVTGSVGSVTGLTASDVAAIKAKTDSLTFTVAGLVDSNVQRVNDVVITGDGSGTPFNVSLRDLRRQMRDYGFRNVSRRDMRELQERLIDSNGAPQTIQIGL